VEMQAFQRLNPPIRADGSCDPLNQLLSICLSPLLLAFWLLVVRRFHLSLLTRPCISKRNDLQDYTRFLDDYHNTLRSKTPTIEFQ
jgi:hypothetical protein